MFEVRRFKKIYERDKHIETIAAHTMFIFGINATSVTITHTVNLTQIP